MRVGRPIRRHAGSFIAALSLIALTTPGSAFARTPSDDADPVVRWDSPAATRGAGHRDADGPPWMLPVQRRVVDDFRPPATQWGAGNRGWEFATIDGDPVVAVGPGVVAFAGWVAGRGVVTLDHGGGLLSSVTGMRSLEVARGRVVVAGHILGRAREGLHLGFRRDGVYIDPALLYLRARHAVLVPVVSVPHGE